MRVYSVLLFFICLNVAGYMVNVLVSQGVLMGDMAVMPYTGTDITSQFAITSFAVAAAGAGLAGLIGLITKQYVFASGAAVIWIIGIFINIGLWLTNGFPKMLALLLQGTGLEVYVSAMIMPIVTFYLFFVLAETLTQRNMVST